MRPPGAPRGGALELLRLRRHERGARLRGGGVTRTCLHCVLARVLRAEADALRERGLEVRLGPSEEVLLPAAGATTYRTVRALLRAAIADAAGPLIRLAVLDAMGKIHAKVHAVADGAT